MYELPYAIHIEPKKKLKEKKRTKKKELNKVNPNCQDIVLRNQNFIFFLKAKRNKYLRYAKHTNVIDFPGTFQT